jgi:YD repeat-containing protein
VAKNYSFTSDRSIAYDSAVLALTDPASYATEYQYDRLGRLTIERSVVPEVADDLPTLNSWFISPNTTRTPTPTPTVWVPIALSAPASCG